MTMKVSMALLITMTAACDVGVTDDGGEPVESTEVARVVTATGATWRFICRQRMHSSPTTPGSINRGSPYS